MAATTIFKKDKLKSLITRLKLDVDKSYVTIGIHEDVGSQEKKSSDDKPAKLLLVEVATFHEYGTEHIPQRSFIRGNDIENKKTYNQLINKVRDKVVFEEWKVEKALGVLGEQVKSDIQRRIQSGIKPDLKEKTIKAKNGKSTPLIDTGQLVQSINYFVNGSKT